MFFFAVSVKRIRITELLNIKEEKIAFALNISGCSHSFFTVHIIGFSLVFSFTVEIYGFALDIILLLNIISFSPYTFWGSHWIVFAAIISLFSQSTLLAPPSTFFTAAVFSPFF